MTDTKSVDTESDILSGINFGEEENDDSTSQQSSDEITQEAAEEHDSPEPNQSGGQDSNSQPQGKQEDRQTSGPQDLKDANGNVIAKGGAERRLYEQAQTLRGHNAQLTRDLQQANAKLQSLESAGMLHTQYNLTPDQVTQGAKLVRGFLDNPIDTLKSLLTQAQEAGHNISDLGLGVGTDVAAIKSLIDQAMQPYRQEQEQKEQETQQRQEGERVFNEFNVRHPDAQIHHPALAQLIQRAQTQGQSLDVETAYWQLRSFYATNGLDWNRPLSEVWPKKDNTPQQRETDQQTIPSGRNGAGAVDLTEPNVANADTPTEDIVRQAMREAGIN